MGGVGVIFREKNSEIYEKILIPFNLVFVRKKNASDDLEYYKVVNL